MGSRAGRGRSRAGRCSRVEGVVGQGGAVRWLVGL